WSSDVCSSDLVAIDISRAIRIYSFISNDFNKTLAPCLNRESTNLHIKYVLPRPDSAIIPYTSPLNNPLISLSSKEKGVFHFVNDSPISRLRYSSLTDSLISIKLFLTSLRTLVLILTDSITEGNHLLTNSCPLRSVKLRSNSLKSSPFLGSNKSTINFLAV